MSRLVDPSRIPEIDIGEDLHLTARTVFDHVPSPEELDAEGIAHDGFVVLGATECYRVKGTYTVDLACRVSRGVCQFVSRSPEGDRAHFSLPQHARLLEGKVYEVGLIAKPNGSVGVSSMQLRDKVVPNDSEVVACAIGAAMGLPNASLLSREIRLASIRLRRDMHLEAALRVSAQARVAVLVGVGRLQERSMMAETGISYVVFEPKPTDALRRAMRKMRGVRFFEAEPGADPGAVLEACRASSRVSRGARIWMMYSGIEEAWATMRFSEQVISFGIPVLFAFSASYCKATISAMISSGARPMGCYIHTDGVRRDSPLDLGAISMREVEQDGSPMVRSTVAGTVWVEPHIASGQFSTSRPTFDRKSVEAMTGRVADEDTMAVMSRMVVFS